VFVLKPTAVLGMPHAILIEFRSSLSDFQYLGGLLSLLTKMPTKPLRRIAREAVERNAINNQDATTATSRVAKIQSAQVPRKNLP
jgi:hypothetical protein